jgi:ParB-like chromosome segregation protein Spo0J
LSRISAIPLTPRLDTSGHGWDDDDAGEVIAMSAGRLRRLLTVLLIAIVLLPAMPASAERIASRGEDADAARPASLAHVREALSRAEVARALEAQGLSVGEVEQRLTQLSAEDLQRLAANLDQIQAAGRVPDYVWILLAVFLAVSTLAIIF